MTITAVVPVKPWRRAKSRLTSTPEQRMDLAQAFTLDVLETLRGTLSVASIVLVTSEPELISPLSRPAGVTVIEETSAFQPDPLNNAIQLGRGWAELHRARHGLLVVPSDLPALTSQALENALQHLSTFERAFVPDATGSGTTLLYARTPSILGPRYGSRSASRHRLDGCATATDVDPGVRRDVDTLPELIEARCLGVGANTESVLRTLVHPESRHPTFA